MAPMETELDFWLPAKATHSLHQNNWISRSSPSSHYSDRQYRLPPSCQSESTPSCAHIFLREAPNGSILSELLETSSLATTCLYPSPYDSTDPVGLCYFTAPAPLGSPEPSQIRSTNISRRGPKEKDPLIGAEPHPRSHRLLDTLQLTCQPSSSSPTGLLSSLKLYQQTSIVIPTESSQSIRYK
ncbi:hypothetical protein MJO28_000007 [Puccinia striiformis f. sp. tritici]|uniref:Uncharacterized protein n=1 Tax=Puccinia striiformis f. sp. tritici TaxID=168172 RepID=A0ACC0EZS0_9BASI|nr:hypothetical protein MJO28_000007 [Puccinia striiformis f. sp. tritici]